MPDADSVLRAVDRSADELVRFSRELVRTRSVAGEEESAQDLVRDRLRSLGASVDCWRPRASDFRGYEEFIADETNLSKRPNVVGLFRGRRSQKTLGFNGHIDVVPEGDINLWKHPPYAGHVEAGRLFGRGACDMKAGLAATIFAMKSLLDAGVTIRNDILVESVIGEESGGAGTLSTILRGYVPDATMIAEPTNMELTIVQAGCLMFRLKVPGKAAHGASRHMGISAVEEFVPILTALQSLERRRKKMRRHPLFRRIHDPVSLNIGKVRAGTWDSTVPESLVAEGRYGVWPGEALERAKSQFEEAVASASSTRPWLAVNKPEIAWFGPQWKSAELQRSHWLVRMVSDAFGQALGRRPKLSGTTGGTDMRLFTNIARVPAVLLGPGDDATAHFTDENVAVKEIVRACKVYALAALVWNE